MYSTYNPSKAKDVKYFVPYDVLLNLKTKKFSIGCKISKDNLLNRDYSRGELHKLIITTPPYNKYWFSLLHRLYPTEEFNLRFSSSK